MPTTRSPPTRSPPCPPPTCLLRIQSAVLALQQRLVQARLRHCRQVRSSRACSQAAAAAPPPAAQRGGQGRAHAGPEAPANTGAGASGCGGQLTVAPAVLPICAVAVGEKAVHAGAMVHSVLQQYLVENGRQLIPAWRAAGGTGGRAGREGRRWARRQAAAGDGAKRAACRPRRPTMHPHSRRHAQHRCSPNKALTRR